MAEARLTLSEAGDAAAAATKRRRLPNSRCFNCGSYAHGIAQCPKDFDQVRGGPQCAMLLSVAGKFAGTYLAFCML